MKKIRKLLKKATTEELEGLASILKCKPEVDEIVKSFQESACNLLDILAGEDLTWREIVTKVANKLKISCLDSWSVEEIEIEIARKVFISAWERMTPQQRKKLESELVKTSKEYGETDKLVKYGSIGTVLLTLTAAQLSGFEVYLLASTALGFLTNALGITLPFVVYTTMSKAISIIIGPVGWIGLGLYTIWALTAPNYEKLIPGVLYICILRHKIAKRKIPKIVFWIIFWIILVLVIGIAFVLCV